HYLQCTGGCDPVADGYGRLEVLTQVLTLRVTHPTAWESGVGLQLTARPQLDVSAYVDGGGVDDAAWSLHLEPAAPRRELRQRVAVPPLANASVEARKAPDEGTDDVGGGRAHT